MFCILNFPLFKTKSKTEDIIKAEMLGGQSSHKKLLIEFPVWRRAERPQTAESELRPNTPWAIINPDEFSLPPARDTNRADLASQSQTHPYLAERE